jgi:Rieske 2Fe-2S family protein
MSLSPNLQRVLRQRQAGAPLPREFYTEEVLYAADLDLVFYKEWLFVGHTCEVPNAGSYFTVQIGEYPIVVVRGNDGVIRAVLNSCRHRGARICRESHGKSPKLVCPYHQWTYNLDGRLFAARQMEPGFDRSRYGLKAVHCEAVAGYVFICLADVASDFSVIRQQFEAYVAPHAIDQARVAFTSTIIEEGNWKLVWENNRECYHCASNHPELARTYADTPAITGVTGTAENPLVIRHWRHCESLGLPSEFRLSPDGHMRTVRVPLLDGARSYTMSGETAVSRSLANSLPLTSAIGALLLFHYPTNWNHVLADHAISFRVLPLGPHRTQLTTKWLVNNAAVEGVDYDLKNLTHVWLETNGQDSQIVAENHIGVASPGYDPGPFSLAHESGVAQFLDWYVSRLRVQKAFDHVA